MPLWELVTCDLQTGSPIGEVLWADALAGSLGLSRIENVTFQVRADNALADRLLETDVLVKAYIAKSLKLVGPVVAAEEVGQAGGVTLAVTVANGLWELAGRWLGKTVDGYKNGTALTLVDRGAIALDMLAKANAEGNTGVRAGLVVASSNTYVGPVWMENLADALTKLGQTPEGFDLRIRPVEPATDSLGLYYGLLDTAPVIGSDLPDVIFEWGQGTGANVLTYRRPVTREEQANVFYSPPPGFPDNATQQVLTAVDADSIARWRRREAVVDVDLAADDYRQKLLDQHKAVRALPRQLITFEPSAGAPQYGVDYGIGDVVGARARWQGRTRFDARFRVYGVDFTRDKAGKYLSNPQLTPAA